MNIMRIIITKISSYNETIDPVETFYLFYNYDKRNPSFTFINSDSTRFMKFNNKNYYLVDYKNKELAHIRRIGKEGKDTYWIMKNTTEAVLREIPYYHQLLGYYRIFENKNIDIFAINYSIDNMELLHKNAYKTDTKDIIYSAKGLNVYINIPYLGYYYLISPDKKVVFKDYKLGDYSELLKTKKIMKTINKMLLLLTMLISSVISSYSQENDGPAINFEENKFSFDTIVRNSNGEHEFIFTNTGTEPLIISSAFSSCGCVVPDYPKQPILPGKKSSIKVKYNTNILGDFTKVIVVKSNDKKNPKYILRISGVVLKEN